MRGQKRTREDRKRVRKNEDEDDVEDSDQGYDALLKSLGVVTQDERHEDEDEEDEEDIDDEDDDDDEVDEDDDEEEEEIERIDGERQQHEDEEVVVAQPVDSSRDALFVGVPDDEGDNVADEDREALAPTLRSDDPYNIIFCRSYDENDIASISASLSQLHYSPCSPAISSSSRLLATSAFSWSSAPSPWIADGVGRHYTLSWNARQASVAAAVERYYDLAVPGVEGVEGRAEIRDVMAWHCVNHVVKTRNRVWTGNTLLRTQKIDEVRDQGFTRCTVLVLMGVRGDAYDFVRRIMNFSPHSQVEGLDKFEEVVAADEVRFRNKPRDYVERFSVNMDDCFVFGVHFHYDSIRLCASLASSDIVVASPLGLRTVIGDEKSRNANADFLSSVEVVVLDSCEMLMMQNWDHVDTVFKMLNTIPKEIGSCDISRLQHHHLNGWSRHLRQTIACGEVSTPEINALFRKRCFTPRRALIDMTHGGVLHLLPETGQLQQVFQKTPFSTITAAPDERLDYFCKRILPGLIRERTGVVIFVSNYFDFVRIRRHMKQEQYDYCHLCEYTSKKDISRDRYDFIHRKAPVLLYTERLHFYHRYVLRGAQHVVFYDLPIIPRHFVEIVSFIPKKLMPDAHIMVLYNALDKMRLERIVGTERANAMLSSDKQTHLFIV